MPFVPSRDGLCFSFIGNVDVCPFSLSRSPRCSRFVFLALSSLSYFLLLVFDPLVFIYFPGAAAAAAGRGSPPPPGARRASVVGLLRALAPLVGHDEVKRARGAGGWVAHSFQPPRPPGPLLRDVSSEMGGPGAGGRGALAYF